MKKRILFLALALTFCLGTTVFSASAAEQPFSGICGENSTWSFDPNTGAMTISGSGPIAFVWEGSWNEVSKGPIVDWAHLTPFIRSVVISEGITSVDANAFSGCENLVSVQLPSTLEYINIGAFSFCNSLKEIELPQTIKYIDGNAFAYGGIERIYFPAGMRCIMGFPFGIPGLMEDPLEIYYGGTQAQFEENFSVYLSCPMITVHYNSTGLPPRTAYARTQNIWVDGTPVQFQTYALKDANGYETNYVKLRDVAHVLNGTAAQFNVGWDGAVNVTPGTAYQANGSEMSLPFAGDRTYEYATAVTNVDGAAANVDAILLKDDTGSGYTYYKLRDLGSVLDFNVGWDNDQNRIYVESNKAYVG